MNVKEFAKRRKVNEQTVRKWVRNGRIEGVTTDHLGRLVIPEEALANCPLPVRKTVFNPGFTEVELKMKKTIVDQRDQEIAEIRAERATLFAQHMELLTKYAGLQGRFDKAESIIEGQVQVMATKRKEAMELEERLEKEIRAVMGQQLVIDVLKQTIRNREDEIDSIRKLYDELKLKYDQLLQATGGPTLRKEELCPTQETTTTSHSIPSTD